MHVMLGVCATHAQWWEGHSIGVQAGVMHAAEVGRSCLAAAISHKQSSFLLTSSE